MNKLLVITGIVAIAILGATNPSNNKYQLYASERLTEYLKEDACGKLASQKTQDRILQSSCGILVDTARPQLTTILDKHTQRSNFLLFSLYETELAATPLSPEYSFTTVGIFDRFFTYQTEAAE